MCVEDHPICVPRAVASHGICAGIGPLSCVWVRIIARRYSYGVFDTVFQVVTCGPLGAFRGVGVPVFEGGEDGGALRPLAWPGREIPQYFIPGLRDLDSNKPTGLAAEAFVRRPEMPVSIWMHHLDRLS